MTAACESNPQAWKDLGVELIPDGDDAVRTIAANNQNVITCCASMFDKWLEKKPKASWRQLIDALNIIGLKGLATEIKEKLESSTAAQVPRGKSLQMPISQHAWLIRN